MRSADARTCADARRTAKHAAAGAVHRFVVRVCPDTYDVMPLVLQDGLKHGCGRHVWPSGATYQVGLEEG